MCSSENKETIEWQNPNQWSKNTAHLKPADLDVSAKSQACKIAVGSADLYDPSMADNDLTFPFYIVFILRCGSFATGRRD